VNLKIGRFKPVHEKKPLATVILACPPIQGILTATSTLASGGDDRRGSLGTAILKYDGLQSFTKIDVTVNGGHLKFVMRLIFRVWSSE
jgi:hypothetical protein